MERLSVETAIPSGRAESDLFSHGGLVCGVSILFNLIMFLSPIMPARSTFPNLVFLVTAVMLISRCAEISHAYVVQKSLERVAALVGVVYFIWTAGFSLWWYHENYQWEKSVIAIAESAPRDQILEVQSSPIYEDSRYGALSGFHLESVLFQRMKAIGKTCPLPGITISEAFVWLILMTSKRNYYFL